jgi:glycosyltransferase involved in cell wall biosynthesis
MKIVFITRESKESPGARIRCCNLAEGLRHLGVPTKIFSFADDLGALEGKEECKMGTAEKIFFNVRAFFKLFNEKKDTIFFIQRSNYHSIAPLLVHLIKGNAIILDIDDWEWREDIRYYSKSLSNSKAELLLRILSKRARFLTTPTDYLRRFLSRYSTNLYILKNTVDISKFYPNGRKINEGRILFSWIGTVHRIDNVENIKFILECFSELRQYFKNIYLEIIGDGLYYDRIRMLKKNFTDEHITVRGWIKNIFMPGYLTSIDVGLCPLIQDNKFNLSKSPVKLFEYMAMGKSTVSSEIGEAKDIVKDGENGFLAKDKKEFIEKMRILIEDKTLRDRIGQRAFETIRENFTVSKQAEIFYRIGKENFNPAFGGTRS